MNSIFHIIGRGGFLVGTGVGAWLGSRYGTAEIVVGALAGGGIGWLAGQFPEWLTVRMVKSDLAKKSIGELRSYFRSSECVVHNYVLMELLDRGEEIEAELPVVLDLLASSDIHQRACGWAAFTSAFPEFVEEVGGYCVEDSIDECRRQTSSLRRSIEQADAIRASASQLSVN